MQTGNINHFCFQCVNINLINILKYSVPSKEIAKSFLMLCSNGGISNLGATVHSAGPNVYNKDWDALIFLISTYKPLRQSHAQ